MDLRRRADRARGAGAPRARHARRLESHLRVSAHGVARYRRFQGQAFRLGKGRCQSRTYLPEVHMAVERVDTWNATSAAQPVISWLSGLIRGLQTSNTQ